MAAAGALAFGVLGTVAYGVWFNHDQQAYAEAIAGVREALGMPGSASVVSSGAGMNRLTEPAAMSGPANSVAVPTAATTATQTITTASASALEPIATGNAVSATSAPAPAAATTGASAAFAPSSAPTTNTASSTKAALVSQGKEGSKQDVWSGQVARAPAAANPQTTLAAVTSATPAPSRSPSPHSTRRASNGAAPATQQSSVGRSGKDARAAQPERRVASANANAKHKNSLFARMDQWFRRVNYPQHDSGPQQQDIYSRP
jgi:hypothetical protein